MYTRLIRDAILAGRQPITIGNDDHEDDDGTAEAIRGRRASNSPPSVSLRPLRRRYSGAARDRAINPAAGIPSVRTFVCRLSRSFVRPRLLDKREIAVHYTRVDQPSLTLMRRAQDTTRWTSARKEGGQRGAGEKARKMLPRKFHARKTSFSVFI